MGASRGRWCCLSTVDQIRSIYARLARGYDLSQWVPERVLLDRLRRRLVSRARGRILEVGIGTGANLPYYRTSCPVTGVDLSRAMVERALARAYRLGRQLTVEVMDAETLTFADRTFDAVVSTLTLCTTPDPVRLLREMARVCRPDGRVLLLEHGIGTAPLVNWALRRLAPGNLARYACHLTRNMAALPGEAGLRVRWQERHLWGVVTLTEAAP